MQGVIGDLGIDIDKDQLDDIMKEAKKDTDEKKDGDGKDKEGDKK